MNKTIPNPQSISAKKAEFNRPLHGESILTNENLAKMFSTRAKVMLSDLNELGAYKINYKPFLEIGAGSTQRSTALINNYPVDGVAMDISQNSLRDCHFIVKLMNYSKKPTLISCDAHNMPFLPNTFNFVFVYQALHHFSNPVPVTAECYRVLGKGGYFYFNEEPMDSSLRRVLRGNRLLTHPPTPIQKLGYQFGVEKLFWDDGAHERSRGMTEARFDIDLWREALTPFKIMNVEVNRKLGINSTLRNGALDTMLASVIGGNVKGLCMKTDGEPASGDFQNRLMCVDCHATGLTAQEGDEHLICHECGRHYPITDNVIRMLTKDLEAAIFGSALA